MLGRFGALTPYTNYATTQFSLNIVLTGQEAELLYNLTFCDELQKYFANYGASLTQLRTIIDRQYGCPDLTFEEYVTSGRMQALGDLPTPVLSEPVPRDARDVAAELLNSYEEYEYTAAAITQPIEEEI